MTSTIAGIETSQIIDLLRNNLPNKLNEKEIKAYFSIINPLDDIEKSNLDACLDEFYSGYYFDKVTSDGLNSLSLIQKIDWIELILKNKAKLVYLHKNVLVIEGSFNNFPELITNHYTIKTL